MSQSNKLFNLWVVMMPISILLFVGLTMGYANGISQDPWWMERIPLALLALFSTSAGFTLVFTAAVTGIAGILMGIDGHPMLKLIPVIRKAFFVLPPLALPRIRLALAIQMIGPRRETAVMWSMGAA